MKICRLLAIVVALGSSGCATGRGPMPGGSVIVRTAPETLIAADENRTAAALLGAMLERGFGLRPGAEHQLVFEKDGGVLLGLVAGSRFNPIAKWRVTFTLVGSAAGQHVFVDVAVVTNPGTGFEQVASQNDGKAARQIQALLTSLQASVGPAQ